jgi:hypothetical protein
MHLIEEAGAHLALAVALGPVRFQRVSVLILHELHDSRSFLRLVNHLARPWRRKVQAGTHDRFEPAAGGVMHAPK